MRGKSSIPIDSLWPSAWFYLGILTIVGCASHPPETPGVHKVPRLRPRVDETQPPGSQPGWEESGKAVTVTTIPVAGRMPGLLYGQGAVWVTGGKFMKIDPASNSIVAELKEASGCVAAVGEGYIWATKFGLKAHDLVRLAPQTGEVTARVRGLPHYRGSPAVGEGSVWLHVAGKVLRIDPKRAEVVATIPTHGSWGTIAFGAGAVWVLEQTHPWPNAESLLLRIDASSNQLTDTLHLGTGAGSIAVGEDAVWVAQWEQTSPREPMPGKLLRIEPRSLRIVRAIPLWSQPAHIVIAAGSVWVSSSEAILRVDPMTNRVTEMVRVPGTFGLAAGAGALWVGESFSSACVYRLELSELTADDSHESQK